MVITMGQTFCLSYAECYYTITCQRYLYRTFEKLIRNWTALHKVQIDLSILGKYCRLSWPTLAVLLQEFLGFS